MSLEETQARDIKSDPPNPAWCFRCDVWDVIMAHIDELDVDEMRAALEDVVFEYHEYCGAGKRDA